MSGSFSLSLLVAAALTGVISAATPISGLTDFGTSPTLAVSANGSAAGAGLLASNVFGYDFRLITNTADPVRLFVEDLAYNQGNGIDYIPSATSVVSMLSFGVTANSHDTFDMQSVDISLSDMTGNSPSGTMVITGYRGGVAVPGATSTISFNLSSGATTQMPNFNVSGNAAFKGIDEFRITPGAGFQVGYFGIDNLNATNFQPVPEASSVALAGAFVLLAATRRRR